MAADEGHESAGEPGPCATDIHDKLAAFALGALDESEAAQFDEHLASCPACAMELDSMLPVVDLLSDVDTGSIAGARQDARVLQRMADGMQVERVAARRLRLKLVAAGSAVVLGIGGIIAVQWSTTAGTVMSALATYVLIGLALSRVVGLLTRPGRVAHRSGSSDRSTPAKARWAEQFCQPDVRQVDDRDDVPEGRRFGRISHGLGLHAPTREAAKYRAARELYEEAKRFELETADFAHDLIAAAHVAQSPDRERQ